MIDLNERIIQYDGFLKKYFYQGSFSLVRTTDHAYLFNLAIRDTVHTAAVRKADFDLQPKRHFMKWIQECINARYEKDIINESVILKYDLREAFEAGHTEPVDVVMESLGYNVMRFESLDVADCVFIEVQGEVHQPLPQFLVVSNYKFTNL